MNRRQFLASAATIAAGCSSQDRRPVLRVFAYAGAHEETMRQVFVPGFEQLTGCRVIVDAGWWDAIGKLKASPKDNPPYDLVITDATQGYPAIKEGLFRQLNLANIPNHKLMVSAALDNPLFKDGYAITYPDSVMTLAYRQDRITPPPSRWGDLLSEQLRGQISLYDAFYMSLYTFACIKVSLDNRPGTAQAEIRNNLEGVLRFARDQRDAVKLWWSTSTAMGLDLSRNNCIAGNMHSPEMLQLLAEQPKLGAVVPTTDRAFVQVMWVIPAGTKQVELAENAINYLFSEEVQLGFARRGSASPIISVAEKRASEDALWKSLYPHTAAGLNAIQYYPYDLYAEHWKDLTQQWDTTILRK